MRDVVPPEPVYLLRRGYEVFGVDQDPRSVDHVRRLAQRRSASTIGGEG
jgi:hypothetical protein